MKARAAALVVLSSLIFGAGRASAASPNVVFFQSDTHRWGAMSFTQTPQVETPNMERLAGAGASLDRYYVNLPICTPYRALMMTGRWPYQQGLMANHMSLAERVDMPPAQKTRGTIAWAFKDAGYATAHFGKWHLGGQDARPFGFDRSVVWQGTNNHRSNLYRVDGGEPERWEGKSNSSATTEQALAWIGEKAKAGRPFFAVISVNPPHGPFHDAPEEKKRLYPDPAVLPFHPLDEIRDFEQHRDYHALISGVDDDLGRVLEALADLDLADDTVLIYTSDHGAMTGIDGVAYGQKRHPNDESSRVPFLIRWPGRIPANTRLDVLASTMDVFPTLAALAGLGQALEERASGEYLASLEGTDLSPFLLGDAEGVAEPEEIYLAHPSNMNNRGSRHEIIWRAIVTRDYTYAVTERGEHRLWRNQPGYQEENLAGRPALLDTRLDLWRRLNRLLDRAERPYYDQWFAAAPEDEVKAWNREHDLGENNADREAGKSALFDMSASRPLRQ